MIKSGLALYLSLKRIFQMGTLIVILKLVRLRKAKTKKGQASYSVSEVKIRQVRLLKMAEPLAP